MSHDVFISYAREDSAAAIAIADLLGKIGVTCWIDRDTIAHQHGEEWMQEIVSAIHGAKVLVLVFSEHANASRFVTGEARVAFGRDLPILPFRVEDVAPRGAMELLLSGQQWLDAFPVYENHLERLAESVCRLLDRPGSPVRPVDKTWLPAVGWGRFVSAHLDHARRFLLNGLPTGNAVEAAPAAIQISQPVAGFSTRKSVYDEIRKESLRRLVESNRWWRIKEVIESLESQGLPLGEYAEAKVTLEKRLAVFETALARGERTLLDLGPTEMTPVIDRLRGVVADHPGIDGLWRKTKSAMNGFVDLRKRVATFAKLRRWTAAENELRSFALEHDQATPSLLEAAASGSVKAQRESRRLDLICWSLVAGVAVGVACVTVERWLGVHEGSFASSLPSGVGAFVVPAAAVLVRLATVATTLGFVLAFFGVGGQGVFAGASLGLMLVAAGAQAAAPLSGLLPWEKVRAFPIVVALLSYAAAVVLAVSVVTTMQMATCRFIGAKPRVPGMTAFLSCFLAAAGFLSSGMRWGRWIVDADWCRWIPDGFVFAALLAVFGLVTRRTQWWSLLGVAGAIGLLSPASQSSGVLPIAVRTGPLALGLLVAGWLAVRPTTLLGHLALTSAAGASCLLAEAVRAMDAGSSGIAWGTYLPLLACWAIACGTVALRQETLLGGTVRMGDMVAKRTLRMRCLGSRVQDRQLDETVWFREGRERHQRRLRRAERQRAAAIPPSPAVPAARDGGASRPGANRRGSK